MEQQNESNLFNNLTIDREAKQHILAMASWAMVVAVVAGIGYVFNILELISPSQPEVSSEGLGAYLKMMSAGTSGVAATLFTIIVGIVINFFLFKFSLEAKRGVNEINHPLLTNSFSNLKNYFLVTSIYVLLVFLYVLVVLLYIIFGANTGF